MLMLIWCGFIFMRRGKIPRQGLCDENPKLEIKDTPRKSIAMESFLFIIPSTSSETWALLLQNESGASLCDRKSNDCLLLTAVCFTLICSWQKQPEWREMCQRVWVFTCDCAHTSHALRSLYRYRMTPIMLHLKPLISIQTQHLLLLFHFNLHSV